MSMNDRMKTSSPVCVLCLTLATPAFATGRIWLPAQISAPETIVALSDYPDGFFEDREWSVGIERVNNIYKYHGINNKTGANMKLSDGIVSGTKSRRIYTWQSKGNKYRITWKPDDSAFIRLQVFDGGGQELLNRLLTVVSP
jgi:hypothetical protein